MYEVIMWLWEHRAEPLHLLTWGSAILIAGKLLDAGARKLITHQVKRIFHVEDEFATYVRNQARIERKLDLLLKERGIECAENNGMPLSPKKQKPSYKFSTITLCIARNAKLGMNWREKSMQINKVWLTGLVAYILGIAAKQYGFTFDDQMVNVITDVLIYVIIPVAIAFMNRRKEVDNGPAIQSEDNR